MKDCDICGDPVYGRRRRHPHCGRPIPRPKASPRLKRARAPFLSERIGERHGHWTIEGTRSSRNGHPRVAVRCDCGKAKVRFWATLRDARSSRCSECAGKARASVRIGQRFGAFRVIRPSARIDGERTFRVSCRCGRESTRKLKHLAHAKSVGQEGCMACRPGSRLMLEEHGVRYGNWTVVRDLGMWEMTDGTGRHLVLFRCDCGLEVERQPGNIKLRGGSCRQCAYSRRRTDNKCCRHCGDPFESRRSKDECPTCKRRAGRNGQCSRCEFPLYRTKRHECSGAIP